MLDRVFSYIAPHSCCSCGDLGSILCESCKNDIIHERFERCIGCLTPHPEGSCRECSKSMGITRAWCIGERAGPLKVILDTYKFRSSKEAARHLVDIVDATVPILTGATVVPVPTASQHRRVRGFDHTELIAKDFAQRRGLSCSQLLEQQSGEIQHFKSKKERLQAAEKSIQSIRSAPRHVVLIDDIMTTGATVRTCVKRLHEAGAEQVDIILVVRQML